MFFFYLNKIIEIRILIMKIPSTGFFLEFFFHIDNNNLSLNPSKIVRYDDRKWMHKFFPLRLVFSIR